MKEELTWPENGADSAVMPLGAYWSRFLRFLRRKWWIPALSVLAAVAAQIIYLHTQPPSHTAVGRLLVGGKVRIPEGGLYSEEWQNFFGTQIEVMKSDKIRQRVLSRLEALNQNKNTSPIRLEVSQIRRTAIFVLSATGKDPAYTEAYLNALMDDYLAYRKEVRDLSSDETLASLTGQFLQQEAELKREREKLLAFQKTNSVALLQEQTSSVGLAKLNAQLTDLKLELQFLNASQEPSQTGPVEAKSWEESGMFSGKPPSDLTTKQWLQMLKFQREEMGKFMRPEHPRMVKLDEEIARAEKLIDVYRGQSREQLAAAKDALEVKIESVEGAIHEWEGRVMDANSRLTEYTGYKANVDRIQDLYDRLLRLLQNVGLDKNVDQETVVVMDRAVPVPRNLTPVKFALAPIIGLMAGMGILLFLVSHDDRLTSVGELRRRFREKTLGQIPEFSAAKRNGRPELLKPDDERPALAEAYRNIHSSLLFGSRRGSHPKTILVAGAMSEEGKSTVAANLARTIAFTGARVLLIDGDLRTGRLQEMLEISSPAAPPESPVPDSDPERLVAQTSVPNLSFISWKQASGCNGEPFLNSRTEPVLKELSARFDYILIDSPPVFAAADAASLAPKVDGVIFVIRDFFTPARLAREALDQLYQRQADVLGIVYNRANGSSRACAIKSRA
jgi:capsular exopolysaccharide synthesis family protein